MCEWPCSSCWQEAWPGGVNFPRNFLLCMNTYLFKHSPVIQCTHTLPLSHTTLVCRTPQSRGSHGTTSHLSPGLLSHLHTNSSTHHGYLYGHCHTCSHKTRSPWRPGRGSIWYELCTLNTPPPLVMGESLCNVSIVHYCTCSI